MTPTDRFTKLGSVLCWIGLAAQAAVSLYLVLSNYEFALKGGYSALAPILFVLLSLPTLFLVLLGLLFSARFKSWPLIALAALCAPVILGFLLLKANCGGMC